MSNLTPRLDAIDNNLVINGSMEYWQRGTSFSASAQAYGADRWKHLIASSHWQALRSTNIPVVDNITYSYQADCTVVASPAAADQEMIEHFIESNIARKLNGKKAQLIFWVSSAKTGQHNVYVSTNPTGTNYNMLIPYIVTAANTWQKIVLTVDMTSCPVSIVSGTSAGFLIGFPLAVGSNRTSVNANAWFQSDIKLLSGSPNLLDNTANNFYVTGVMLVPYNSTATTSDGGTSYTYAGKDLIGELRLCQRYFEKSYDLSVVPGTVDSTGCFRGIANNTAEFYDGGKFYYKVPKRLYNTYTLTFYNDVSGAANNIRNNTGGSNLAITNSNFNISDGQGVLRPSSGSMTAGNFYTAQWTVEAEY